MYKRIVSTAEQIDYAVATPIKKSPTRLKIGTTNKLKPKHKLNRLINFVNISNFSIKHDTIHHQLNISSTSQPKGEVLCELKKYKNFIYERSHNLIVSGYFLKISNFVKRK